MLLNSANDIAKSSFDSFANLIESSSNGRFDKMKAKEIRNLARKSVGVYISAKAMELKHTTKLIQLLDSDIAEIEEQTQTQVQDSPVTTIPGISFKMAAMIQAEIGDFNRFSSSDKILAFASLSPTTYQSGNFTSQKQKWISAAHAICVMLSSFLPNMSVCGEMFSKIITERNAQKASITLSRSLTLLKNSFASSSTSKKLVNLFKNFFDS